MTASDSGRQGPPSAAERSTLMADLITLQADLQELQGDSPLILPSADDQAVASVVQDWTGIPVGRMVKNEVDAILQLAGT